MGQSKKLFSKLDWFSGVFTKVSINELLADFQVYFSPDVDYILSHRYMSSSNTGSSVNDQVIELLPGVQVRIPIDQISMLQEMADFNLFLDPSISLDIPLESFCNYHWMRMIFNCSGQGLDNLRELGYNVDENLRCFFPGIVDPEKGKTFHVTRADFAFDFINWGVDLPVLFDSLLHEGDLRKGLWYGNNKQPLITECRISSKQSTVYIGHSGGSNKILRIYDKLQQFQSNLDNNVPLEYRGDDGRIPDSWVRVELQARREVADSLLSGHDPNTLTRVPIDCWDKQYWAGVLRWIGEYYAPRLTYGEPIADFWITFFDWSLIESVIQNAKYVHSKTRLERAESFFYRNGFSTVTLLSHQGLYLYLLKLRQLLEYYQSLDSWDYLYQRLCSAAQLGCCVPPQYLVRDIFGKLHFQDLDLVLDFLSQNNVQRKEDPDLVIPKMG